MAGLADAATDRASVASAPALTSWSVCAWVKPVASASFSPIVRVEASGGTAMVFGLKSLAPSLYSAASTTGINGTSIGTGTYTFVAATRNGTAAALYWGTNPGSLSKVTGTVNSSGTPDIWTVWGRSPSDGSEWFSGVVDYLRTWGSTVLTDAEVAAEGAAAAPVKAGTWGVWPFGNNGSGGVSLNDTSGNARHLVAGSTPLALVADVSLSRNFTLSVADQTVASTVPIRSRGRSLPLNTQTTSGTTPTRSRGRTAGLVTQTATEFTPTRSRARTAGPVTQTAAPTAPVRTRSRTIAAVDTTTAAQAPTRSRGRSLATVDQTSVAAAPLRTRAVALALAVTSTVAQLPSRVRARVLGVVDGAATVLLPTRTRARTTATVDQQTVPLTPARGNSQQFALPVVNQLVVPIVPARSRTAHLGLVLQSTLVLPLDTEAGPWPPHRGPGQLLEPVAVGPGRPVPRLAVGPGNDRPEIVVGDGVVP